MSSETPTVVHSPSSSAEVISTRVTAAHADDHQLHHKARLDLLMTLDHFSRRETYQTPSIIGAQRDGLVSRVALVPPTDESCPLGGLLT